jgi:hypothetical protein
MRSNLLTPQELPVADVHVRSRSHRPYADPGETGASALKVVRAIALGLLPPLALNVLGTVVVYFAARMLFPESSLLPLLLASLVPAISNVFSVVHRRRIDPIGATVFVGLGVSAIGVAMGGGQQLLLIRESFATAAIGFALLASLGLRRPLGYYFARQMLTGNDPRSDARIEAMWQRPGFGRAMRLGTLFWGLLLLGEFLVRIGMVLTLPVVAVLVLAPIVFDILIIFGISVSAIWAARVLGQAGDADEPAAEIL